MFVVGGPIDHGTFSKALAGFENPR